MFTDAEKSELEGLLSEAFDAFKERIVIYKTPVTAYISSERTNFNFAFGENQADIDVDYITNSGEFWATVEYAAQSNSQKLLFPVPQSNLLMPYGDVRISTSGDLARSFLEECEKIVLDGKDFRLNSDIMPRGLFGRNGFDCWLKKIDNG